MATVTPIASVRTILDAADDAAASSGVLALLEDQDVEVASIGLTDGTGTALAAGRLSLNAAGDVVIHDFESNAEDLPHLVNSRESINFATRAADSVMTGATTFSRVIVEIPIKSSEITNGKLLHLSGDMRAMWGTGTKPDGGAFLFLCKEGETPTTDGAFFNFAEGTTSEFRNFVVTMSFTVAAGVWTLSFNGGGARAICAKNDGGTVTTVPAWTYGSDMGDASTLTGDAAEPIKLVLYLVTINTSATVAATLSVSGNFSAILE